MCMTAAPAHLSGTLLYAGEGMYNENYVHVIAYQNRAYSHGPNAMIIPFPAAEPMTEANVIDTRSFKSFLKDMSDPFQVRYRGAMLNGNLLGSAARVFDVGSYTVVLAESITQAKEVLDLVSESRRPYINYNFVKGFSKLYPNWPVAICCWEGEMDEVEPLLWWYKPEDPDQIFAPTMDAHDGLAPNLSAQVEVDHYLMFGSNVGEGASVHYTSAIPETVRGLLPMQVKGTHIQTKMLNGDFRVSAESLQKTGPAIAYRGGLEKPKAGKVALKF